MSAYAGRALIVTFPPVPITREGHFGLFVSSGDLSFDRAPPCSRPTGAFCHQNLQADVSIARRLVPAYLLGAAVVGRQRMPNYRPAAIVLSK